ncbi:MAG: metal-dependent hydrolase [Phaeodactylibacter sp.]|nr:metal-dependent hydrolase [Phaeodactylibacter sp.]MCB9296318.1 metal-dependent hydrolase [Lewinellaceae bacterium]
MDSLTQITLGAAVGEAVLGRKVGNRAMLWGAIGGTIPDLDVFANMVTDDMSALAFHRAITHSFAFAFIAPLLLGWLVHRLYDERKTFWADFLKIWLFLVLLIGVGAIFMPIPPLEVGQIALAVSAAILVFPAVVWIRRKLRKRKVKPDATQRGWTLLFFWAIFTHPLLDACTTYGTQLFQPFWDYRVAFNNISVVDPLYTLPFLFFVIIVLTLNRQNRWRPVFNYIGIGVSSAYMLFTFYNKVQVDRVFESSLRRDGIAYQRYMTSPTIFNNVLWQGVAEGDTAYYHGMYSLMDSKPEVLSFVVIPKNHHLIDGHEDDRSIRILRWFSSGYYSILERPGGQLQFNDLRFGSLGESFDRPEDFVFHFLLEEKDGVFIARESWERERDAEGAFGQLWERIKGK